LIAFNQILSRQIDAKERCVFTITHFKAGQTGNVFPDEAYMQGTIRSYKEDINN
jgi:metal-dependent amidase/aminoacylase/carboxypeptidase family protein